MQIRIDEIKIEAGRREINPAIVAELADSIREIGLLNPITILPDKTLIAGLHRIEAQRLLGLDTIEAIERNLDGLLAKMAEIDENLKRNELHYIEAGDLMRQRKMIYEELHPETRQGGDRRSEEIKRRNPAFDIPSFVSDTATTTGRSQTVIKAELQIANNIVPEVKRALREKDIAKTDAIRIARLEPGKQMQAVNRLLTKPHVTNNSGNNEWYTPSEFIESARTVMGSIDLDPASSDLANETVQAAQYYTMDDDGLDHEWHGCVWLNPPYSTDLVARFIDKLAREYQERKTTEAIVLVNNTTETEWFITLVNLATAVVFPKSRIKFMSPDGVKSAPLQGQAFIYIGCHEESFFQEFLKYGWGAILYPKQATQR